MHWPVRSSEFWALWLVACSTNFSPQPCSVDEDCGGGLVCELHDGDPVCVSPEDAPLIIGQSAPLSGTNQALGTGMKLGVELAFKEKNEAGGIRGRKLVLAFRDDAYQPELAEQAARTLVDAKPSKAPPRCPTTMTPAVTGQSAISMTALERGPNAVLAFLGSVGTPTMVRAAPVVIETSTIFFGAVTGAATILRDDRAAPCNRFIFNVRASYAQEARATVEYFRHKGISDSRHLVSFDQDDAFGQAGYEGLVLAYQTLGGSFPANVDPSQPIARFRYTRNDDSSVPAQAAAVARYLATLLSGDDERHVVGIMMAATYGAAAEFIRALRTWQHANESQQSLLKSASRLELYFSNLSFVGPNALSERLLAAGSVATASGPLPLTEGVLVSQVVPNYQNDSTEIVRSYNRLIAITSNEPSFTSLEGYITARVFIAGLEAHQGPFQAESLVASFERMPELSLGLGASSGFSSMNHQYSNSVWGTLLTADGRFTNLYFWSAGIPIQFFE